MCVKLVSYQNYRKMHGQEKKKILNVSCKLKEKLFESGYYVEE